MNKFRLLRADEIECRVSQINENGLSLLLYKTARTDANLLDETFGPDRWQNDFKIVDGVLYGGIGIESGDGEWIWKWDAGTESNTEAEKGRASDAFKRAGFKWGIGRELYTAPFTWISSKMCIIKEGRNGKLVCNDDFVVSEIEYNDQQEISSLKIVNEKTQKQVFSWKKGERVIPPAEPETPRESPDNAAEIKFVCSACGANITDAEHDFSVRRYRKPLCRACQKKA